MGSPQEKPEIVPVAIVATGFQCAGALTCDDYWRNIAAGRLSLTSIPKRRFDSSLYTSSLAEYAITSTRGGFVPDDGYEGPYYDLAYRVATQCLKEALAGLGSPLSEHAKQRGAVILGNSGLWSYQDYALLIKSALYESHLCETLERLSLPLSIKKLKDEFEEAISARVGRRKDEFDLEKVFPSSLASHLAREANLSGPAFIIDTACSSSLAALETAVFMLSAGHTDVVISGGIDMLSDPLCYLGFSLLGGLSPDGARPFDADANGLVVGEGGGLIILKRLEDALSCGDRIRAVIKGIGGASDGRGKAVYAPSQRGIESAINNALKIAGWSPDDVDYLEAHATSTPVGDATEYRALSACYGTKRSSDGPPLRIGSIKEAIGHTKAAAGVANIIKVILAMENRTFPRQVSYKKLDPKLDESPNLHISNIASPWHADSEGIRRGAVSASGFGGINYHVLLEGREDESSWSQSPPKKMHPVSFEALAVVAHQSLVCGIDPEKQPQLLGIGNEVHADREIDVPKRVFSSDFVSARFRILPHALPHIDPGQILGIDLVGRLYEKRKDSVPIPPEKCGIVIGSMYNVYYFDVVARNRFVEYEAALEACPSFVVLDQSVQHSIKASVRQKCFESLPSLSENTLPGWIPNVLSGRIAKTFDIRGENMIVDAGPASSIISFLVSFYQLQYAGLDSVIAGGISATTSFPGLSSSFIPGGALFSLKRLSDAKDDDISCILSGFGGAYNHDTVSTSQMPPPSFDGHIYSSSLKDAIYNSANREDPSHVHENGSFCGASGAISLASWLLKKDRNISSHDDLSIAIAEKDGSYAHYCAFFDSSKRMSFKDQAHFSFLSAPSLDTGGLKKNLLINESRSSQSEDLQSSPINSLHSEHILGKDPSSQSIMMGSVYPITTKGNSMRVGSSSSQVAFLFPGQGSQYLHMGHYLYKNYKIFREVFDRVRDVFLKDANISLDGLIYPEKDGEDAASQRFLNSSSGSQYGTFAVEIGVFAILRDMGIHADAFIGHSFGELSALTAAGVWDIETGSRAVIERVRAVSSVPLGVGKMISLTCSKDQAHALTILTGGRAVVANVNFSRQTVVSGDNAAIDLVEKCAISAGIDSQVLDIDGAFHSPMMMPAVAPFFNALEKLPIQQRPQVPILSTTDGQFYGENSSIFDGTYLARRLSGQLTLPIDFPRDIKTLYHKKGIRYFVECGPKRALSTFVTHTLKEAALPFFAVATLHPKAGDEETFRRAQAFFLVHGLGDHEKIMQEGSSSPDSNSIFQDDTFERWLQGNHPHLFDNVSRAFVSFSTALAPGQPLVSAGLTHALVTEGQGSSRPSAPKIESLQPPAVQPQRAPQVESLQSPAVQPQMAPAIPSISAIEPSREGVVVDADSIQAVIRSHIVSQTGYPEDMLEGNLDLEGDLGIDTLKQAEIWSVLGETYKIEKLQDLDLRASNTIEKMAETILANSQITSPSGSLSTPSIITNRDISRIGAEELPSSSALSSEYDIWCQRIQSGFIERTGYHESMFSYDLDLIEGISVNQDLLESVWNGLVSVYSSLPSCPEIIRVRTIGALAKWIMRSPFDDSLKGSQTQGSQAGGSQTGGSQTQGSQTQGSQTQGSQTGGSQTGGSQTGGSQTGGSQVAQKGDVSEGFHKEEQRVDESSIQDVIRKKIIEQTGYPEDMLESDLDLEGDLGIDTLKQAEIWTELGQSYRIEDLQSLDLRAANTISLMAKTICEAAGSSKKNSLLPSPEEGPVAPNDGSIADSVILSSMSDSVYAHPQEDGQSLASNGHSMGAHATDGHSLFDGKKSETALVHSSQDEDGDERITAFRQIFSEITGYLPNLVTADADLVNVFPASAEAFSQVWERWVKEQGTEYLLSDVPDIHEHRSIRGVISFWVRKSSEDRLFDEKSPRGDLLLAINTVSQEASEGALSVDGVLKKISSLIALKTGYPEDMLEVDLDLEGDLGIDTLKQAEIWTELGQAYTLQDLEKVDIRTANTMREMAKLIIGLKDPHMGGVSSTKGSSKIEALVPSSSQSPSKDTAGLTASTPIISPSSLLSPSASLIRNATHASACFGYVSQCEKTELVALQESCPSSRVLCVVDEGEEASSLLANHVSWRKMTWSACIKKSEESAQDFAHNYDAFVLIPSPSDSYDSFVESAEKLRSFVLELYPYFKKECFRVLVPIFSDGLWGLSSKAFKNPWAFSPSGFMRTLVHECPSSAFCLVDLGGTNSPQQHGHILEELMKSQWTSGTDIGFRDGHFYRFFLQPEAPSSQRPQLEDSLKLKKGDPILVTGGARGITSACVYGLAQGVPARFILTGRTFRPEDRSDVLFSKSSDEFEKALPQFLSASRVKGLSVKEARAAFQKIRSQRELESKLHDMEKAGILYEYHQCDVSDPKALRSLIRDIENRYGLIRGVIHGAGVEYSKNLPDKTDDEWTQTLVTKLMPIQVMLSELSLSSVRLWVNFGSVSGVFGNGGQCDYALANSVLTGLGCFLRSSFPKMRVCTFSWTGWQGLGMVKDSIASFLQKQGLCLLSPEEGVKFFLSHLNDDIHGSEVVVVNPVPTFHRVKPFSFPLSASQHAGDGFLEEKDASGSLFHKTWAINDAYVFDHQVFKTPVIPGAFSLEMMAEGVWQNSDKTSSSPIILEDVTFFRPIKVQGPEKPAAVSLLMDFDDRTARWGLSLIPKSYCTAASMIRQNMRFAQAYWSPNKSWRPQKLSISPEITSILDTPSPEPISLYTAMDMYPDVILQTRGSFRGLQSFHTQKDKETAAIYAYGRISLPASGIGSPDSGEKFLVSPLLIDLAIQVGANYGVVSQGCISIPQSIEGLCLHLDALLGHIFYVVVSPRILPQEDASRPEKLSMDVVVYNTIGQRVLELREFTASSSHGHGWRLPSEFMHASLSG